FLVVLRALGATLFPYTTLFRSRGRQDIAFEAAVSGPAALARADRVVRAGGGFNGAGGAARAAPPNRGDLSGFPPAAAPDRAGKRGAAAAHRGRERGAGADPRGGNALVGGAGGPDERAARHPFRRGAAAAGDRPRRDRAAGPA